MHCSLLSDDVSLRSSLLRFQPASAWSPTGNDGEQACRTGCCRALACRLPAVQVCHGRGAMAGVSCGGRTVWRTRCSSPHLCVMQDGNGQKERTARVCRSAQSQFLWSSWCGNDAHPPVRSRRFSVSQWNHRSTGRSSTARRGYALMSCAVET